MTTRSLLRAFSDWSAERRPLVLASVFETAGSTYSKVGAQMLITDEGKFQGMLSGGCLEGDLAERARKVLDSGRPQSVTYDLAESDDALWGLGVGCDGLMKIFLQPLLPATGYEPFASMATALGGDSEQVSATIVDSNVTGVLAGAASVMIDDVVAFSDVRSNFASIVDDAMAKAIKSGHSACRTVCTESGELSLLLTVLKPPPSILVLGAGPDAEPVVRLALELGWRVTVQDHRPAYIEAGAFDGVEELLCVPVEELSTSTGLDTFAAAIVMSHHLMSDRQYLRQLADSRIAYIGLLGPSGRRRRLVRELGSPARKLENRLHGPAGIDIGSRGPASIALSIIAEMHGVLSKAENY